MGKEKKKDKIFIIFLLWGLGGFLIHYYFCDIK